MIIALRILFIVVLVSMIAVTTWAGSERNLFEAGGELLRNPWGVATLADAYFGFLTFYVWVAYKERTVLARVAWFILIMALGNIAMSFYVLLQLFRMPASGSIGQLLLRRAA
ncbi:MAG: DUF1475 family protein [Thermoanaerobaculia bacterium]